MSDGTSNQNQNQLVTYLLIAIVVLLVAIVAIVVIKNNAATSTSGIPSVPGGAPVPTTQPGMAPSTGGFDVKTATKVPSSQQPEAYVKAYYQAILDKKWEQAFNMQPATSKAGNTVADFQTTQTGYGMQSFKVVTSSVNGNEATVQVEQDLGGNGKWGAIWTFVKDGGAWLVKSRQVSMQ